MLPSRLTAPAANQRAASVWAWIQRKPTTIIIIRTTALAAQTVRIEMSSPSEMSRESGVGAGRTVNLFGVQGHDTIPDLDIERGDNFQANDSTALNFSVIGVDRTQIGQIQAICQMIE
jgi:hypothetical protein